jgi:hypothetical protein
MMRPIKLAIAAIALMAAAAPVRPAAAQPYLGWDFGGGVGIGIGPPPSAYTACPNYGWPYYPYRCRYHPRPAHPRPRPPAAWTQPPPSG